VGKAIPHGIYDVAHNLGWVTVGQGHDTASFAVESPRRWWRSMGQRCIRQPFIKDGTMASIYVEEKRILMGSGS
jgi:hypothetical protein